MYTVEESASSQAPSAVHTVKNAEVVELTPITRLLSTAESEIVGSPIKAFYICDLCMFTVDLTSLIGKYGELLYKTLRLTNLIKYVLNIACIFHKI